MDEQQWVSPDCPVEPLLQHLRDRYHAGRTRDGKRKLRLFACACARQVFPLLENPVPHQQHIEAAERYADGSVKEQEAVGAARLFDTERRERFPKYGTPDDEAWNAVYCAVHRRWVSYLEGDFSRQRWKLAAAVARDAAPYPLAEGFGSDASLLREIFGNPFRPITIKPAWRTSTVLSLAQAAYDERHLPSGHLDTQRLAILADALEDAGCDDEAVVSHLRSPGPPVRGCHLVDWLLGKS